MKLLKLLILLPAFFAVFYSHASKKPIPIKVVIVTLFEVGEDTGDTLGEFQLWNERRKLEAIFPSPHMDHDIHVNLETGVMGIVTGMGTAKATAAVMALGMDSRFDLTNAYWIVAGISGFDPEDSSVGSVSLADILVDADLAHTIDPREMPKNWEHSYIPLFSKGMHDHKRKEYNLGEVFELNRKFVDWAYNLTKDAKLLDHPALEKNRKLYTKHPNARRDPFVLIGAQLAGQTYWHGRILNDWANDWVNYWTNGWSNFVSSAMEDTGIYTSLNFLDRANKARKDRLLVIRAASNYTMQPPDKTAFESLSKGDEEGHPGVETVFENIYIVGSIVIDELLDNWNKYKYHTPE